MFAKLFELACFHIVKAAERGGWEPKAPRPVVRVVRDGPCAKMIDDRGLVVGACMPEFGPDLRWNCHALIPHAGAKVIGPIYDQEDAIDTVVAELSTWAEVDTGEVADG